MPHLVVWRKCVLQFYYHTPILGLYSTHHSNRSYKCPLMSNTPDLIVCRKPTLQFISTIIHLSLVCTVSTTPTNYMQEICNSFLLTSICIPRNVIRILAIGHTVNLLEFPTYIVYLSMCHILNYLRMYVCTYVRTLSYQEYLYWEIPAYLRCLLPHTL